MLKTIWEKCSKDKVGSLTRDQLYHALGLLGMAQDGRQPTLTDLFAMPQWPQPRLPVPTAAPVDFAAFATESIASVTSSQQTPLGMPGSSMHSVANAADSWTAGVVSASSTEAGVSPAVDFGGFPSPATADPYAAFAELSLEDSGAVRSNTAADVSLDASTAADASFGDFAAAAPPSSDALPSPSRDATSKHVSESTDRYAVLAADDSFGAFSVLSPPTTSVTVSEDGFGSFTSTFQPSNTGARTEADTGAGKTTAAVLRTDSATSGGWEAGFPTAATAEPVGNNEFAAFASAAPIARSATEDEFPAFVSAPVEKDAPTGDLDFDAFASASQSKAAAPPPAHDPFAALSAVSSKAPTAAQATASATASDTGDDFAAFSSAPHPQAQPAAQSNNGDAFTAFSSVPKADAPRGEDAFAAFGSLSSKPTVASTPDYAALASAGSGPSTSGGDRYDLENLHVPSLWPCIVLHLL